ncbi:unnamed protein product [Mytilus edulis]|uniref:Integrase zinc-binding domain-containing protein n=1 Tax=Mytilus edulis TaxID=6550 RepID=A0A8S3VHI5_MYTED|nr:unnamed protein product [Mytilus edulis]
MESEEYKQLYNYVSDGQNPPEFDNNDRRSFRRKAKLFQIKNNEMYYIHVDKKTQEQTLKLVIHKDKLKQVLYLCHNESGCHLGVNKTCSKISGKYYFPRITDIVKKYISVCDECQHQNKKAKSVMPELMPVPCGKRVWDTLLSYSNLVIGSDEKKALVKAIKDSFPTSELTLCTRHLSENVTRHLRTKVGVNDKNAKQILFWDNRLIEADTTVDINANITEIERTYKDPVGLYLTRKVGPSFRDYVYNARKTFKNSIAKGKQ